MRKACLEEIYRLAKKDSRVVYIGSDLGAGTLSEFKRDFPERFFMEGVSEAHIIGMASGLAREGKIVYVNTIATFITRRCFEQNVIDLGFHNAQVRLIGNGGGLVYAPLGPTHLAIDDMAIMRTIPNMTVVACSDELEMRRMMRQTVSYKGPIYIRLAKGGDKIVTDFPQSFKIGKAIDVEKEGDILFLTTGITLQMAMTAREILRRERINAAILHVPTIKPLDRKRIVERAKKVKIIITLEEHSIIGGLGSAVAEVLSEEGLSGKAFKRLGLPDKFPEGYGSQKELLEKYELTAKRIAGEVKKLKDKI